MASGGCDFKMSSPQSVWATERQANMPASRPGCFVGFPQPTAESPRGSPCFWLLDVIGFPLRKTTRNNPMFGLYDCTTPIPKPPFPALPALPPNLWERMMAEFPAFVHEKTQRRCCLKHGAEKLPIQLKPSSFWQHPLFWLMFESPDVLEYMSMCMCMYIYICVYACRLCMYMFIYLCMYDSSTQPRLW